MEKKEIIEDVKTLQIYFYDAKIKHDELTKAGFTRNPFAGTFKSYGSVLVQLVEYIGYDSSNELFLYAVQVIDGKNDFYILSQPSEYLKARELYVKARAVCALGLHLYMYDVGDIDD